MYIRYSDQHLIHLSHRFTSASKSAAYKSFDSLSQTLPHLVGHHLRLSYTLERISLTSCEWLYATNTSHRKQETFFMTILCIECFFRQTKDTTKRCSSVVHAQAQLPFLLLKPASEHLNIRMRVCYLDCQEAGLCCYLVIHIGNPITSITTVLLPFVTYLLTLPRSYVPSGFVNG
jgi:hypothetical protein